MPLAVHADWLPASHELFPLLRADPRELQYAVRLVEPVSYKPVAEAALGDYLGIYRWNLGDEKSFQVSMGGGAFGRFDLSRKTNDMETADFFADLPLDFRSGRWSFRFMPYHTSAHLGDDYLKRKGAVTEKHSWDNLKWLASYRPLSCLKLYGGYNYVFRTLPGGIGRHAVQGGFETESHWKAGGHVQFYWANDIQSWERAKWNPTFNSQAGMTMAKNPEDSRSVSVFLEYTAGREAQGQLYRQQESRWTLGLRFSPS